MSTSRKAAKNSSPKPTSGDAYVGPPIPGLAGHADVVAWTPRLDTYHVVGPVGIVETHSGIGLSLRDVVRHLCRHDWPKSFDGIDVIVYDGTRAVAKVVYAWHGRPDHGYPRAYWLWDREGDHEMGETFIYAPDLDDDDDDQGDDD